MTIIERFLSGTYAVRRSTGGQYVEGVYQPGPIEELHVRGSLQPLSPRELKLVQEGARLKQFWKFFTDVPIGVVGTRTLAQSDVITINGDTYKVYSVEIWQGFGMSYYKSILWREPENT